MVPFHPSIPAQKGFTLMELLVVISIVAVLAALAFPVLSGSMKKARTSEGASRLQQIGVACKLYFGENRRYPGAHYRDPVTDERTSWKELLAPYLNINPSAVFDHPAFSDPNVETQWSQAWPGENPPSYSFNPNLISSFSLSGESPVRVKRPSEVMLAMDASTQNFGAADANLWGVWLSDNANPEQAIEVAGYQASPRATPRFRQAGGTPDSPGAANVLFCDGHVALVKYGELKQKHFSIAY